MISEYLVSFYVLKEEMFYALYGTLRRQTFLLFVSKPEKADASCSQKMSKGILLVFDPFLATQDIAQNAGQDRFILASAGNGNHGALQRSDVRF